MNLSAVNLSAIAGQVLERIAATAPVTAPLPVILAALVTLAATLTPSLWCYARLAVTIVHELGHASVGILAGRRFTGFVVNGDMSGHAVTVGPRRGIGRTLCTWAGYPAPAIVGTGLVLAAVSGRAPLLLLILALILLVALVFARSGATVLALITAIAVCGAGWWWGRAGAALQVPLAPTLLLTLGLFLLLGAWRHLGAVMSAPRGIDDPQVLAQLTGVPALLWNLSFAAVLTACTIASASLLAGPLEPVRRLVSSWVQ